MSLASHLLIAHPNLKDRMFTKSVVLMIEDETDTGSVGVVLNKPSNIGLPDFFRMSKGYDFQSDDYIRCGGPVNTQAVSLLHDDDWYSSNTYLLQRGLAVSSDEFMVEKMSTGNTPYRYRMFTGLASWGPGQLQAEINSTFPYQNYSGWLTMPADRAIVFEYDGEKQWEKALELCTQKTIENWF